jgi:ribokinase
MSQIRDKERTIVFDPAQEIHRIWNKEKFMTALNLSDILFCNKFESVSALKYAAVNTFSEMTEKTIICTEGAKGSEFFVNGKRTKIPVVDPKRTADNTGAGDAYRAGFYAGQYNKYSDVDSLIIGAATASFAVEEVGALSNIPSLDAVMERADRYLGKL